MHIFTPRTAALLLALAATSAQAATFDYFESFDDESTFTGAPDKPCGVGRADANPKLLLNDT